MVGFQQTTFSFMTKKREYFHVSWRELKKYIQAGKHELVFRLKEERFHFKRHMNPLLKKHFGFTYHFDKTVQYPLVDYEIKAYKIEIYNKTKFLFFKIKYEL